MTEPAKQPKIKRPNRPYMIRFRVDARLYEAILREAQAEDDNVSAWLRKAIRAAIRA